MQVKNNYDILWREEGGTASGMGMFNGDIGVIRTVDQEVALVDFDGKLVEYTPDMLGSWNPPSPSPYIRPRAASTGPLSWPPWTALPC